MIKNKELDFAFCNINRVSVTSTVTSKTAQNQSITVKNCFWKLKELPKCAGKVLTLRRGGCSSWKLCCNIYVLSHDQVTSAENVALRYDGGGGINQREKYNLHHSKQSTNQIKY